MSLRWRPASPPAAAGAARGACAAAHVRLRMLPVTQPEPLTLTVLNGVSAERGMTSCSFDLVGGSDVVQQGGAGRRCGTRRRVRVSGGKDRRDCGAFGCLSTDAFKSSSFYLRALSPSRLDSSSFVVLTQHLEPTFL